MKPENLILIVVVIAVFYFLLMMPQRRQQKQRQQMMQQLGPGAEVLTAGGIYGKIVSINDDQYLIEVANGVELKMDQRSIVRVVQGAPAQSAEAAPVEPSEENQSAE